MRSAICLVLVLSGCAGPATVQVAGAPVAPPPAAATARVVLRPTAGFRLLGGLIEPRKAIHHVNLALYKRGADGTYPATPAATVAGLGAARIAAPIVLTNLRPGATYKVAAAAYDAATESAATLLSVAATSQKAFTMPAVTTAGGVQRGETAVDVALPLDLTNRTYAGQASYTVKVRNGNVAYVKVTLARAGTSITTTLTPPYATSYPLTNLRMGTAYTLSIQGYKANNGVVNGATASQAFTTPAVDAATGTIDTTPLGPYALALN